MGHSNSPSHPRACLKSDKKPSNPLKHHARDLRGGGRAAAGGGGGGGSESKNTHFLQHGAPSLLLHPGQDHIFDADLKPIFLEGTKLEIEERSYQTLLPVVRSLLQICKERSESEKESEIRLPCAICQDSIQYRGWGPLVIHAQKFWKRFPYQHQGYYRALKEAFKVENFDPVSPEPVSWPPVLLVENSGLKFDGSLRRWKGLQGEEVPDNIKDVEIEEILAVYKKGSQDGLGVMVFPASEVGFVDAKKLAHVLETSTKVDDWLKLRIAGGDKPKIHGKDAESCKPWKNVGERDAEPKDEEDDSQEGGPRTADSENDYEEHHPFGTWASIKEIKERDRAETVMEKWAGSFAGARDYCAFALKRPFRKSKRGTKDFGQRDSENESRERYLS